MRKKRKLWSVDRIVVIVGIITIVCVPIFQPPYKSEPWPDPPPPLLLPLESFFPLPSPPREILPMPVEVPQVVRELPEMVEGPNGRVHRIVGPDGEVETKTIHRLTVEMRVYASDGTYTIVDETVFSNSFRGDAITGVWK